MKTFFFSVVFLAISFISRSQCNVIATAMPLPASCPGACDGQILYTYQNLAAPGAPYMVVLSDGSGNVISINTYLSEVMTIPFTNLCADDYTITVQGTSCLFTTSALVTEPAPMTVYVNVTDPAPGMSDGSAEILVSGGTGPYTFGLNCLSYSGSNIFTGLSAGTYTACVQDNNGCSQMVTFTCLDVTSCDIVVTATPASLPSCAGSCDASLQYFYADGNSNNPYLIELTQGGITQQTATNNSPNGSGTFTNLCSGVYNVEVTNAQGCTGTFPVTIMQPPVLAIGGVTVTNATSGNSDGSAVVNVSGGVPAYQYSLDGVTYQAGNVFTGLSAGVYVVYVQDSNGCIVFYTFIVQEDPGCFFNVSTLVNQGSPCAGSCDASLTYTFSGVISDPPFTITLENSGSVVQTATSLNQTVTGTFTGLCSGDYTLTVTNSSGCEEVVNITISQPAPLSYSFTSIAPTIGNNDGSIHVNVIGGTAPYEFSIDNMSSWQTSPDFTGLGTGFYIINIQDANGCMGIVCIILNETTGCDFTITAMPDANSCANACDGSVIYAFNDAGNHPPYSIELMQGTSVLQTNMVDLSNGGTGQFLNLCEGVYTLQVTDGNGCTDEITVYVDAPDYLFVSGANISNSTAGNSDGEAEILVSGGTAPYQFSLDNGLTWSGSNYLTGLSAGFYILMVEDANGCSAIFCFVVNEDPGCTIATTLFLDTPVSCHGACDGALDFAYSEGTPNPPYLITLSNNGTSVATMTQTSSAFSGTFNGLCAGNYSISVTNGSGCQSLVSNYTLTEPDAVMLNVTVTDASAGNSNGVAVVNATGGTGQYSYSLDGITWQASNVFDGLSSGAHIAYVQDENGCSNFFTFLVGENLNCNIALTVYGQTAISCSGMCDASVNFTFADLNSNLPYTVILTNSWGGTSTQTFSSNTASGQFTDLCTGTYTLSVQDVAGCMSIQTFVITSPSYLNVGVSTTDATAGNTDGSALLSISGGTAPYEISIDNQVSWQTSNLLSDLGAGVYIVYVKDANGCSQIFCFFLGDSNVASINPENENVRVYPNPSHGLFFVESMQVLSAVVYDLNGKQIQAENRLASNGVVIDLTNANTGVYILEVLLEDGSVNRVRLVKE